MSHASTADINLHYIGFTTPITMSASTANNPTHCPYCSKDSVTETTSIREFDYVDTLCSTYAHLKRAIAYALIQLTHDVNSSRSSDHQLSITEVIERLNKEQSHKYVPTNKKRVNIQLKAHGIAPLLCTCTSSNCGGTYTLLRSFLSPTSSLPKYCVWCGQSTITVRQFTTNETANLVLDSDVIEQESFNTLSTIHNLPVSIVRALHDEWQSLPHFKHFNEVIARFKAELAANKEANKASHN